MLELEEKERYELALFRIGEIAKEEVHPYFREYANLLVKTHENYHGRKDGFEHTSLDVLQEMNEALYQELLHYETSYTNPAFAAREFGVKCGQYFSTFAMIFRENILKSCRLDPLGMCLGFELFLQVYGAWQEENGRVSTGKLKEILYYHRHDYMAYDTEEGLRRVIDPDYDRIAEDIRMLDEKDERILYRSGRYVSEEEIKIFRFLTSLEPESLQCMADTYVEGIRKGYEMVGQDIGKKKQVQLRFHVGFEPMIRYALKGFAKLGLRGILSAYQIQSTEASRQVAFDHQQDDRLYFNHAMKKEKIQHMREAYEKFQDLCHGFAGPAVVETFGEDLFQPEIKEEAVQYEEEDQKLHVEYVRDASLLQNEFMPGDDYQFTIIAFPIPAIGPDFEEIFRETMKINTLDVETYQRIQQCLIDALDQGERVHVKGKGDNRTDIIVALAPLKDPATETRFENCLADVNIPVGEVFTSPKLEGTNGVLHVSYVYLNQLLFQELEIKITEGKVTDYTCRNYDEERKNKAFIKEHVLFHHDTLPLGEFAIGTNTLAYRMGRKYGILDKLPILIAEKTGPHFAVGDTCYSHSEEVVVRNPDGKEMIAKENSCSALRKSDPASAYFNCHLDITLPFDELEKIAVIKENGEEIVLIRDGKFVLPGTEGLNKPLEE